MNMTIRKMLIIPLLIAAVLFTVNVNAEAKTMTDKQIMEQTVRKHYGNKTVKLLNGNGNEEKNWKIILHRKNKPYVVVEKVVSVSDGRKHGWYNTKDGGHYIIGYNKRVPKGKRVTSYVIWDPHNNECDGYGYVVDNGKVR